VRNAEKIRSLKSEFRNESVGRTRKTSAAMSQIALRASDGFPVAMQQLEKSPVGSPAANSKTDSNTGTLEEDERQSWQQHVKMLLSF
jgi:hypothetical protein